MARTTSTLSAELVFEEANCLPLSTRAERCLRAVEGGPHPVRRSLEALGDGCAVLARLEELQHTSFSRAQGCEPLAIARPLRRRPANAASTELPRSGSEWPGRSPCPVAAPCFEPGDASTPATTRPVIGSDAYCVVVSSLSATARSVSAIKGRSVVCERALVPSRGRCATSIGRIAVLCHRQNAPTPRRHPHPLECRRAARLRSIRL